MKLSDPDADPWEAPKLPSIKWRTETSLYVGPCEFSLDGWGVIIGEEMDNGAIQNVTWIAVDQLPDLFAALENAADRARACAAYYKHDIAQAGMKEEYP